MLKTRAVRVWTLGIAELAATVYSMIRKSGCRFSEKIMLKQEAKAKWRFNL